MKQIILSNPQEIHNIVNYLNLTYSYQSSPVTELVSYPPGYIKCYAPSLDFPCILNPYYLYPPFYLYLDTKTPYLIASEESGEINSILSFVKDQLITAIIKYKHVNISFSKFPSK